MHLTKYLSRLKCSHFAVIIFVLLCLHHRWFNIRFVKGKQINYCEVLWNHKMQMPAMKYANLYKNIEFLRWGVVVVPHCVVLGGHWTSKIKWQCGDIWWEQLLTECHVMVLSIYQLLGWFSAFQVSFPMHSVLNLLGASMYFHSKPLYGHVELESNVCRCQFFHKWPQMPSKLGSSLGDMLIQCYLMF